jgi:hypothetical protein
MSFHKRYISNEQVIRLFNDGGVSRVIQWYTKGVDALITETGIASKISMILNDSEWLSWDPVNLEDSIANIIHQEIGSADELKK